MVVNSTHSVALLCSADAPPSCEGRPRPAPSSTSCGGQWVSFHILALPWAPSWVLNTCPKDYKQGTCSTTNIEIKTMFLFSLFFLVPQDSFTGFMETPPVPSTIVLPPQCEKASLERGRSVWLGRKCTPSSMSVLVSFDHLPQMGNSRLWGREMAQDSRDIAAGSPHLVWLQWKIRESCGPWHLLLSHVLLGDVLLWDSGGQSRKRGENWQMVVPGASFRALIPTQMAATGSLYLPTGS